MGTRQLARRIEDDEIHVRLVNWGNWLRYDNTYARLGYPSQAPFVFSPRKGHLVADNDAEWIEEIVSTLYIRPDFSPRGHVYAFILRVEYAEHPDRQVPHVSQRAEDVRRRFRRRCSESTYYQHLAKARLAVQSFAGPMR